MEQKCSGSFVIHADKEIKDKTTNILQANTIAILKSNIFDFFIASRPSSIIFKNCVFVIYFLAFVKFILFFLKHFKIKNLKITLKNKININYYFNYTKYLYFCQPKKCQKWYTFSDTKIHWKKLS